MIIEINSENFKKEILESKIPVIIDFFADWCWPCQMMKPIFESTSKDFNGKLKFAKVNTDENSEIAEKFEIQGIPCFVIINKGKEVNRIVGYMNESSLKQKINEILEEI